MIVYSNVAPGALYYVGVKAEDQEAAQYAFMGVFSLLPFGEQDQNGNWILQGINVPALIPDGTAARPGVTNVVAIAPAPIPVRRVVVTNESGTRAFPTSSAPSLMASKSVVLNNHSLPPVDPVPYQYTYIYEDNGEGDIPGAQPTDGPGSLRNFIGEQGNGRLAADYGGHGLRPYRVETDGQVFHQPGMSEPVSSSSSVSFSDMAKMPPLKGPVYVPPAPAVEMPVMEQARSEKKRGEATDTAAGSGEKGG